MYFKNEVMREQSSIRIRSKSRPEEGEPNKNGIGPTPHL